MLYRVFIKSILDYACIIWNPKNHIDIQAIELVQNRFLRFTYFKFYSDTPDFRTGIFHSVHRLRTFFNCPSLFNNRNVTCLLTFKRILDGKVNCGVILEQLNKRNIHHNLRKYRRFLIPSHITQNYCRSFALYQFFDLYNELIPYPELIDEEYNIFKKICTDNLLFI